MRKLIALAISLIIGFTPLLLIVDNYAFAGTSEDSQKEVKSRDEDEGDRNLKNVDVDEDEDEGDDGKSKNVDEGDRNLKNGKEGDPRAYPGSDYDPPRSEGEAGPIYLPDMPPDYDPPRGHDEDNDDNSNDGEQDDSDNQEENDEDSEEADKIQNYEDIVAPKINGFSPYNMAIISVDSPLKVVFSEPMRESTITASTFNVKTADGTPVNGNITMSYDGTTATFTPSSLEPSTLYKATVSTEVEDVSGNPMAFVDTWNFSTVGPSEIITVKTDK